MAAARPVPKEPGADAEAGGAWAPLRRPVFRALWLAIFVANTGTWAQTVGAQWLMGDLGGGAFAVALVQTAATLPVFLLVVPSGAFGDIVDRRRLLLCSNVFMLGGAAALAVVTALDVVTPELLLALTATIGVGVAFSQPALAAIQPELVPIAEIPQAALLNGANLNVARALGPALGGVLIGAIGPAATFALNAVSQLGVIAVLFKWQRRPEERPMGAERLGGAVAAGVRYVRSAPAFGVVLLRSLLFIVFASALWALLPVVARGPLRLGAGGYGLLLAAIGAGAVAGAFVVPVLRRRLATNGLVATGTVATSLAFAVIGASPGLGAVIAALVVTGFAWITVMSSLAAAAQVLLPSWTRARGLSFFTLTFMGGQAIGSVVWGAIAAAWSLEAAFGLAAIALVAGPLLGAGRLGLTPAADIRSSRHWPEPNVEIEVPGDAGPVLVTIEWRIEPPDADAFIDAMQPVGRSRRRTGATLWGLFQDVEDPAVFLETFTVSTWEEHLRQHIERQTVLDEELEARARRYLVDAAAPRVRHLIFVYRRERREHRVPVTVARS